MADLLTMPIRITLPNFFEQAIHFFNQDAPALIQMFNIIKTKQRWLSIPAQIAKSIQNHVLETALFPKV